MSIDATATGAWVLASTAKAVLIAAWSAATSGTYLDDMGAPGLAPPSEDNVWLSERRPQSVQLPGFGLFVRDSQSEIVDGMGAADQVCTLEVQVWAADTARNADGTAWVTTTDATVWDEQAMEAALRAYVETAVQILVSANVGLTNYDLRTNGSTGIFSCRPARGYSPQRFMESLTDGTATWTEQLIVAQVVVIQRRALL